MSAAVIGRPTQLHAIEYLLSAVDGPAVLMFEGDPGIGKTTLVLPRRRRRRCRAFATGGG